MILKYVCKYIKIIHGIFSAKCNYTIEIKQYSECGCGYVSKKTGMGDVKKPERKKGKNSSGFKSDRLNFIE